MASSPKRRSERPKRSPAELQVAAHHVTYEIGMLFFSAEDLGGRYASPLAPPEDMAKNMALECFLLHFRNLRAFFFLRFRRPQYAYGLQVRTSADARPAQHPTRKK